MIRTRCNVLTVLSALLISMSLVGAQDKKDEKKADKQNKKAAAKDDKKAAKDEKKSATLLPNAKLDLKKTSGALSDMANASGFYPALTAATFGAIAVIAL